ncbi:MAG: DUF11 domain-containing protein, partial [Pirellulales bacterium]|nr:DUF11 domain-containing protein [Pirellulales bacterium]
LGNDPLPAVPPPALNRSMSPPTAMPELAPPASVPPFGNLATPVAEANGTGQPASDRRLDGLQTSRLTIQKSAPKEIQVGKPAIFRTTVRNVGHVTALGVQIRDRVPKGTRLIKTLPEASPGTQGDLVWSLDDMQPESETTVEMHVMPMAEGEIGSVATLSFQTDASVRTFATRPELSVEVACPREVLIDEEVEMVITISNTGTGVATGVVLEERVPTGLQHPAGAELEYTVGKLGPKQSQTLKLKLSAVRAGAMENVLIARGDGLPTVKKQMPMAVVAPTLKVAMDGPQSRYLERQATYRLSVSNPGSAPAKNVRLEAQLPRGLKFVEADKNGHYDPQSRTIRWALAELPVNETGTVELTALPVEIGTQKLTFRSVAEKALAVEQERQIKVDGLAAIRFQVVDVDDPIEVGGKTTYEIRVLNQGSKDATGVQVVVELPAGLSPVAAEGPDSIRHAIQGNQVVFAPLARLSPKVDTTYRIRVEGRQTGDHRVRVHLQTAEMDKPVVKEESTRVFSDK